MRIVVLGAPGRHLRGNASSCGRSGRVHFRVMDGHRDHGCAGIPPGVYRRNHGPDDRPSRGNARARFDHSLTRCREGGAPGPQGQQSSCALAPNRVIDSQTLAGRRPASDNLCLRYD